MIPPSLGRLKQCHHALIRALDAYDIDALEAAIEEFRTAVEEVRARGGWHQSPEVRQHVADIRSLTEAARIRVNFLADANQRRIEALAAARGQAVAPTYGRDGIQTI